MSSEFGAAAPWAVLSNGLERAKMRKGFKALIVATLMAAASSAAFADGSESRSVNIGWRVNQPTRFMVSGVLRKNGTTDVIKPIQSIIVAEDEVTAIRMFEKSAQRDFPSFSLIATLASPVPPAGKCENSI